MSGKVEMVLSARDAGVVEAWLRARQGPQAFEDAVTKAGRGGKKAGDDMATSFNRTAASLAKGAAAGLGFGGVLQSIHTVAALIRKEFDAVFEQQRKAANLQLSSAASLEGFFGVLPTGVDPLAARKRVLAAGRGRPASEMYSAAESAFSARGDLDPEMVFQIIEDAALARPAADGQALQAFVGGSLEIAKRFGTDAETSNAYLQRTLQTSRIESLEPFARNVVPQIGNAAGLAGIDLKPEDFQFIASVFSAFSQKSGDARGELSATATIKAFQQVMEETAGIDELEGAGLEARHQWLQSEDPRAVAKRQRLLSIFNRDRSEREAGLEMAGDETARAQLRTEAKAFGASIEFFQPATQDTETRRFQREAYSEIGTPEEARRKARANREPFDESPEGRALALQRALKQYEQTILANDEGRAFQNIFSDFQETLGPLVGSGTAFGGQMKALFTRIDDASSPEQRAAILEAAAISSERKAAELREIAVLPGFGPGGRGTTAPPTEQELVAAERLDALVIVLRDLAAGLGADRTQGQPPPVEQPAGRQWARGGN